MEEWRDIKGYEGRYKVSNTGKVLSILTNKELCQSLTGSGYLKVLLSNGKSNVSKSVHRLVAEAFIPNPQKKKTVNHIDCDKTNNNVENLEWNTYSENLCHAYKNGLNYWHEGKGNPYKKVCKIDQYSGEILETYDSIADAYRANKLYSDSSIIDVCKGINITSGGYVWRYEDNTKYLEDFNRFLLMLRNSDNNTSGKEAYKSFCEIVSCKECWMPKRHFYKLLRHNGVMRSSGTVFGKTERNVIYKREIAV